MLLRKLMDLQARSSQHRGQRHLVEHLTPPTQLVTQLNFQVVRQERVISKNLGHQLRERLPDLVYSVESLEAEGCRVLFAVLRHNDHLL